MSINITHLRQMFFPFLFSLCAVLPAAGQIPDSIKIHIDSSLHILKEHSLYANRVDWATVESQVYAAAQQATTKSGTFTALKIAFDALGDKHAAYYQFDDQYKLENVALNSRYTDSIKAAWQRGVGLQFTLVEDIAYARIPYIGVVRQNDIDTFATWIFEGINKLQDHQPKGWVIDLRLNGGGNIRPMLAGLSRFFEEGIVGYYIDKNGNATDEASFHQGKFRLDGITQANILTNNAASILSKVAVLIGPGTASSGEGLAAALRQRKLTRFFGTASAGLANATGGFVFNNNDSYFLISTANLGGPSKNRLPESIQPDVLLQGNEYFSDITKDTEVKTAIQWLKE